MKRRTNAATAPDSFQTVRAVGRALPLATHPSAEAETLVVRSSIEGRECLLEDAPDTYYLTDYYRRHLVVLVRLACIERDALRDLLSVSWRLILPKARRRRASQVDQHGRMPGPDPRHRRIERQQHRR